MERVVGSCPEVMARLATVDVRCLIDTGAQVSTITEDCFQKYFETDGHLVDLASRIRIVAANGLTVPYVGYIELDVVIFGVTLRSMGFLVKKNSDKWCHGGAEEDYARRDWGEYPQVLERSPTRRTMPPRDDEDVHALSANVGEGISDGGQS